MADTDVDLPFERREGLGKFRPQAERGELRRGRSGSWRHPDRTVRR